MSNRWCSTVVVQLIRNQQVAGSNPATSSRTEQAADALALFLKSSPCSADRLCAAADRRRLWRKPGAGRSRAGYRSRWHLRGGKPGSELRTRPGFCGKRAPAPCAARIVYGNDYRIRLPAARLPRYAAVYFCAACRGILNRRTEAALTPLLFWG